MTANLPMGGNIITGHGTPSVSTDVPNKAYVDAVVAAFFSTGDVKPTFKTAADSGWLMMDDGTFGSASSGSSNSNSVSNLALFTLFFNNMSDTAAPILTSGGGATTRAAQSNASAAWAANCRMSLPKALGRAFGAAGAGSGLTARALGSSIGNETSTIGQVNLPAVNLTPNNTSNVTVFARVSTGNFSPNAVPNTQYLDIIQGTGGGGTSSFTYPVNVGTVPLGGSGTALPIMQPTVFANWMVKQ